MSANRHSPWLTPHGECQFTVGSRGLRLLIVTAAAALLLAGCGDETATAPPTGKDGLVDATPRALAAIVIDHVDPGEPRRTTGGWSDWNDPLQIEAQVDYGVDPEGSEDGETRTVRIAVADRAVYAGEAEAWLHCRRVEKDRCEESTEGDATVLYRWYPGVEEEEPGSAGFMVVRPDEVVRVFFEGTDYYDEDPRGLDLGLDLDDLRAAAVDPAMSLRTSQEAWEAGAALDSYTGVEEAPEKPEIVPTTPHRLARSVADYLGIEPTSVRRSKRDDLGPEAVGAHLEFAGTARYDRFAIDVLTTVGRASQIDPLPCPVQRSAQAAESSCFAWDDDTAATWTLADGDQPGVLWIFGAQDDDKFNRVESVAVRIESTGIVQPFFTDPDNGALDRLPRDLFALSPMTSDLRLGPETTVAE
jgi:hypothetical protein